MNRVDSRPDADVCDEGSAKALAIHRRDARSLRPAGTAVSLAAVPHGRRGSTPLSSTIGSSPRRDSGTLGVPMFEREDPKSLLWCHHPRQGCRHSVGTAGICAKRVHAESFPFLPA